MNPRWTKWRDPGGAMLIELLVAVLLFSIGAAALAQTLIVSQQVRASSTRWLRATQLADERLERLRAGDRSEDWAPIGEFTRSWRAVAVDGAADLERIDVTVTWEDRGRQTVALSTLQRRPR